MSVVRLRGDLKSLNRQLASAAKKTPTKMRRAVAKNVKTGQRLARANSRRTSGAAGIHHPASITSEMTGLLKGEWGPDRELRQGNMDFEYGSGRQTAPHLPVTKSGDVVVPKFVRDVHDAAGEIFS